MNENNSYPNDDYNQPYNNVDHTQVMNTGDYANGYENQGYSNSSYRPREESVTGAPRRKPPQNFYTYAQDNGKPRGKKFNGRYFPFLAFVGIALFSFITLNSCNSNPTVTPPTITQTVTETVTPSSTPSTSSDTESSDSTATESDELSQRGEELGRQAKDGLDKAKELGESFAKGFKNAD